MADKTALFDARASEKALSIYRALENDGPSLAEIKEIVALLWIHADAQKVPTSGEPIVVDSEGFPEDLPEIDDGLFMFTLMDEDEDSIEVRTFRPVTRMVLQRKLIPALIAGLLSHHRSSPGA